MSLGDTKKLSAAFFCGVRCRKCKPGPLRTGRAEQASRGADFTLVSTRVWNWIAVEYCCCMQLSHEVQSGGELHERTDSLMVRYVANWNLLSGALPLRGGTLRITIISGIL